MRPEPAHPARPLTDIDRVRGTQSLLSIVVRSWRRPRLLAVELAWRWLFGIPALALLLFAGRRLLATLYAANIGLDEFSLQQPLRAIFIMRAAYHAVAPALLAVATWMAPLLMLGWAVASGFGRAFLLRALIPTGRLHVLSLSLLQLVRMVALVIATLAWFALLRWAAARNVTHLPPGAEPDLVAFAAWVICLSLGSFVVWALSSWVLSIACVLVVAEDRSVAPALAQSVRQGALTMQLVEINLVLGIVKLALIVLAMVFSAIPLPFEAQMSGALLHLWYVLVAVWYLATSDFFQVARLAGFSEFWKRARSTT